MSKIEVKRMLKNSALFAIPPGEFLQNENQSQKKTKILELSRVTFGKFSLFSDPKSPSEATFGTFGGQTFFLLRSLHICWTLVGIFFKKFQKTPVFFVINFRFCTWEFLQIP